MHPTQDEVPATRRFATFAAEARPTSAVYATISDALAADPPTAAILDEAPLAQRRATLLFAAVHDLLLRGVETGPLRAYYPSVGGELRPDAALPEAFRRVLIDHRDLVIERLRTRATQTNEPGRTLGLRAGIAWLHAQTPDPRRRLAIVEIGTSAGLLLHLDRIGLRLRAGNGEVAAVLAPDGVGPDALWLEADLGPGAATPPSALPAVAARVGIDRHPLRVADADDRAWLRACVWPEHVERLATLDAVLAVARAHGDVQIRTGDLLDELLPAAAAIDPELQLVVVHSATLAYLAPDARQAVEGRLDELGATRPVWRVGLEGHFLEPFATQLARRIGPPRDDQPSFVVAATRIERGRRTDTALGRMQSHGRWLAFTPPG